MLAKCGAGSKPACPWPLGERPTISGDTGSDRATAQISRWLQTCSYSHKSCNGVSEPQMLPTRVLEILSQRMVRLKVTNKAEAARYTTLSHAWGNGNTAQTTSSTLPSFQNNIPWELLPKTFQEAIQVTLRLGLKYIWIDSLCIVQDNVEDWRQEGSQMSSIYSRSYLTIAATKSSSSDGGCFTVSDPRYVSRTYKLKDAYCEEYTIHVRDELDYTTVKSGSPSRLPVPLYLPLLSRAWVFQERLLSTRILHFGPQKLMWECFSCSTCECGSPWDGYTISTKYKSLPWKPDLDTLSNIRRWHATVVEYSTKMLTVDTDIFPALQGISKRVKEEQRKCAYYAGLWEDSLPQDLLWYTMVSGTRTQQWRAPSWSWASVKGHVKWRSATSDFEALFSVLEISTEPIGSNLLGGLRSGSLNLKGPCVTTSIQLEANHSDPCYTLLLRTPGYLRSDGPLFQFYPDFADTCAILGDAPLMLMKAARTQSYMNKDGDYTSRGQCDYDFLVFEYVDTAKSVCKRVGLADLCAQLSWRKNRSFLDHFDQAAKEITFTVI